MSENIRAKSPEELETQVNQVSEELAQEIIQPSKKEEILNMPLNEIKEKFPARYEMYLKTLRTQKANIKLSEKEKSEMSEWLGVLNNLDSYIENHHINDDKTLRERQITVFEDMRDFLEEGGKDGYIKLPTGAGKTVIFSEFIEATGLKTLIVVPTKILIGQTEKKLEEFAEDLDIGKIYSDAKTQGKDVTIITYQSLVRGLENGTINPKDYKCLILDEAHTSLTEKRIEAVDKFKHAIRIGFTATPKYSEDKNVGQLLNTEIHNLEVKEAAEEGVISPFSVILAETNIDTSNVNVTSGGEYNEQDLERAINTEGRNNSAVELYEKMFNGQLAIAYCSGIKHAKDVAKLFNEKRIRAEVISGKQSTKEQTEILTQFKEGEIKVLCNADILIVGFDEPKVSVCLNLRPTLSPVIAEQRGGRALRLNPDDPTKHATIVDFIDRNENENAQSITFAEIAGASVVYPSSSYGGSGGEIGRAGKVSKIENPGIKIEGLKVITNSEEVMRIVSKIIENKSKPAPEGWMVVINISKEISRGEKMVKKTAEKYREAHPEWFKYYLIEDGRSYEHYSPELIVEIKKQLEKREPAPEGWMVIRNIVKEIGRGEEIVKKTAEKYREKHPEWFKDYLIEGGRLYEHYSPNNALNFFNPKITARYSASLLVNPSPKYSPNFSIICSFSSQKTTPIAALPGFPLEPPSV